MTLHRTVKITLVLMAALIVATSAFAGHRSVFISTGTTLAGTEIPKGQYDLIWKQNGSTDSYDIKVRKGGRVLATGTATLVDRGAPAERDQVVTKLDESGGRTIEEIHFRGKSTVLVIDG
jgi:hypothetical protein